MPTGMKHTSEAKRRISVGAQGKGRGGFNVRTHCSDCLREMSPANIGKHYPACQKTKLLVRVFGRRPTTGEMKSFEASLRPYEIDTTQYLALMERQEWTCAICRESLEAREAKRRAANIDHSHVTGKVRGLLCLACNVMIGLAQDNTERLKSAIKYLEFDPYKD